MKKLALVTIAIPIFNAEHFLHDCIQSVLNQSYTNFELLLLDDGSTDNSMLIASSYSDKRISVYSDGLNRGLVYRLNQSIDLAKGEYYARMDADDIMHVNRIEKQINYLINNEVVDVVGTFAYSINIDNKVVGILKKKQFPISNMDIIRNQCFNHPTIMGRTTWFRKHKYNPKAVRMEDFDLWLRSIEKSHFSNIEEPLFFYREAGLPTFRKYIISQIGILRLGFISDKLALSERVFLIFISLCKCFIYVIGSFVGLIDYIMRQRSLSLSSISKDKANILLKQSLEDSNISKNKVYETYSSHLK